MKNIWIINRMYTVDWSNPGSFRHVLDIRTTVTDIYNAIWSGSNANALSPKRMPSPSLKPKHIPNVKISPLSYEELYNPR